MARIIAGTAGGRRLSTPSGDATRPTTDRVREAFFSSLAAWVGRSDEPAPAQLAGLSFLDLFAGSGAVALEAASRGAAPVVAVEKKDAVARLIRDNARVANLDVRVHRGAVEAFLGQPASARADAFGVTQGFDVVWLDPPYAVSDAEVEAALTLIVEGGWLGSDALVVVERSSRSPEPVFPGSPDSWQRRYGETVLHHAQY